MPLLDPVYVSFPKLWNEVGGNCSFGLDKVIQMISIQDDINIDLTSKDKKPEDFKFIHGESYFIVPAEKITEYFAQHEKPDRPMGPAETIKFLKAEVKRLKSQLKVEEKTVVPPNELEEAIPTKAQAAIPEQKEKAPERDPDIPKKDDERLTMEDIQQELKNDPKVQKKFKPITPQQRAAAAAKNTVQKRPNA